MTTQEFYNLALSAVEERGLNGGGLSVSTQCNSGGIYNSCTLYMAEKGKFIDSKQHPNPQAAIEAFRDEIDFYLREYDKYSEGVEI